MKKNIFKLLRYSGLPFIIRNTLQRGKVSILIFHDISSETAEITFEFLKKRYNIIDLNDYLEAVKEKKQLPPKSLIITFDDGHLRNYEMLQIAKTKGVPVTIFLCAGIVNTNRHFWPKYAGADFDIEGLKRVSNKERLSALKNIGFEQEKNFVEPQAMNKSQIDEMRGTANFQSHTVFHPCLPMCTAEESQLELRQAKEILESEFALSINAIAYPNGDYSDRDIKIAKQVGYSCGITVDFGYNTKDSDLFRLKRLATGDTSDLNELAVKSSGLFGFIKTRNGRKQRFGFTTETK